MRLGSTLWFLDVFGVFGMIKLAFDLLNLSSCVFLRMNGPEPSCCELKKETAPVRLTPHMKDMIDSSDGLCSSLFCTVNA